MNRTLICDADDTLWENNIHFEAAIDRFVEYLTSRGLAAEAARRHLIEVERRNVKSHGYGSSVFVMSLRRTLEDLGGGPASEQELRLIEELGRGIQEMPIEFLPGVRETLAALRQRFQLILFTKGDLAEQRRKVSRSGVAHLFHHVEVTPEKDRRAYVSLLERHRLHPPDTWMIGNSPRSDINPALAAGLNAILIPHPRTWELEHEEVEGPSERLTVLERFEDLLRVL